MVFALFGYLFESKKNLKAQWIVHSLNIFSYFF